MVELKIQDGLWNELAAVAQRQRTPPQALAERIIPGQAGLEMLPDPEGEAARQQAEAMKALVDEYGLASWAAPAALLAGWTLAAQGQAEEGIAPMLQGLKAYRAMDAPGRGARYLILLAEA